MPFSPSGDYLEGQSTAEIVAASIPSREDIAYEVEIMKPVRERGKFANWIAAPKNGANRQPLDFDYVRFV
jgi:benzoyl-CoA 2,3-dioxygenase component B